MPNGNNPDQNRRWPPKDQPMFWITAATFIAVCVYAFLTNQQVNESRTANEIANKAFYTSNRPYVMWTDYSLPIRVNDPAGKLKEWRISPVVKNFGKTGLL
jgi:amino acid transporter